MELSEVYEALVTLREFCLEKKDCSTCELRRSPICTTAKNKLKDMSFYDPKNPPVFSFFD